MVQLRKWIDGNLVWQLEVNRITGYKIQACLIELLLGGTMGVITFMLFATSNSSGFEKFGVGLLGMVFSVGMAGFFARDAYVAAAYWPAWRKPHWLRYTDVRYWRMRYVARKLHLCASQERCVTLLEPDEVKDLVGPGFVDTAIAQNGFI